MLTKNLLNYTVRKKQVYPKFLDSNNANIYDLASRLLSVYKTSKGLTFQGLQEKISLLKSTQNNIFDGLNKLLLERVSSVTGEDPDDIISKRWSFIIEAQKLRQESLFSTPESFYESLELRLNKKIDDLQTNLYIDLPECQEITNFELIDEKKLIERYNCAQVQGLLINAAKLIVSIKKENQTFKRTLFRQIKFHRLLCKVIEDTKESFTFELSGPLSIFNLRQTYGMRFANFFPHVLHAQCWNIAVELVVKKNNVLLKLDESSGLKSHYSIKEPYFPKELLSFIDSFNKKKLKWRVSIASEFLNMGEKSYCFPDITFERRGKIKLHLELFHRWHHTQFVKRLELLEENRDLPLFLGVCKHILEKKEVSEVLEKSLIRDKILSFHDFPTAQKISKYLDNYP